MLDKHLIAKTRPKARAEQLVLLGNTRITVLAPGLIRVEVADSLKFNDEATQIVWYRDLGECKYTVSFNEKEITITTDTAVFHYNRRKNKVDYVYLDNDKIKCGNKNNLKGTARTLDWTFGPVKLKDGVMGRDGVAVMRDDSLILAADGMVRARSNDNDIYIFANKDYRQTLKDFYGITGFPPMAPRYALGNWWSRYHAYTQEEYLELTERFQKEDIPFSVATIDMDWHWVDIEKEFGKEYKRVSGWTGYSWNKKLFPDYKEFLSELHKKNYKTIMNLHPAKGVRSFEDAYGDMCRAVGKDPAKKETVSFDLTDETFINAYFSVLHAPYERDGVDAWWIDWQQGKKSKLAGYDPLWGLNHYHTLHAAREGKRPLILSRYGGLGSHRYPVGFSGDTGVLWKVLKFQPYFTANASNAGYIAWSHDIGGHYLGKQNLEDLYLRWIQFGVFSPVTRLHSSNNARSKEPWNYPSVEKIAKEFLRLRHRLIPFIYSANYQTYSLGRALCEPMYYAYPEENEAYNAKAQYLFGGSLIVAPITDPADKNTGLASVEVWLPKGRYTDIFTGQSYEGGRVYKMERDLNSIPVLAEEGAIIPLSLEAGNSTDNPKEIEILVYSGNGAFTLYEDDGETEGYMSGDYLKTPMTVKYDGKDVIFTINKGEGNLSLVPAERKYAVNFKNIAALERAEVTVNGAKASAVNDGGKFILERIKPSDAVEIRLIDVK